MSETVKDEAAIAEQEDAAFGSGFTDKPAPTKSTPSVPDAAAEPVVEAEAPADEYVQVKAKDWEAATTKAAHHDQQIQKQWGTIGQQQKTLNELTRLLEQERAAREQERAAKADTSSKNGKDALADMKRDYPEIAAGVEANYAGLEEKLAAHEAKLRAEAKAEARAATIKAQMDELEDEFPDWRNTVGAVDATREAPDPNNAYRKWLATQDATYQERINNADEPAVVKRSLRRFQNETKAAAGTAKPPPAASKPREDARPDRFRGAVQPRGDNAGAAAALNEDDEFAAGFKSR